MKKLVLNSVVLLTLSLTLSGCLVDSKVRVVADNTQASNGLNDQRLAIESQIDLLEKNLDDKYEIVVCGLQINEGLNSCMSIYPSADSLYYFPTKKAQIVNELKKLQTKYNELKALKIQDDSIDFKVRMIAADEVNKLINYYSAQLY